MRQRAMIAMALACRPALLIADEPTTALDVTIQAQILTLVLDLQQELGMGLILITHDLGVVAQTAQRVIVMYAGKKVEEADVEELFARSAASLHPRADGLDPAAALMRGEAKADARLAEIPGMVPSLTRSADGLRLRAALRARDCALPRRNIRRCRRWGGGHLAACWRAARTDGDAAMTERRRCSRSPTSSSISRCAPACCARRPAPCMRSTASASRSAPARRSGWSASPAAANRRSAAACCG